MLAIQTAFYAIKLISLPRSEDKRFLSFTTFTLPKVNFSRVIMSDVLQHSNKFIQLNTNISE